MDSSKSMKSPRLNTIQFLALRSIARGTWDFRLGTFEWRFNGKWVVLHRHLDRSLYDRSWDAALELEGRGLVEIVLRAAAQALHATETTVTNSY